MITIFYIKVYITTLIAFLGIDAVWLGLVAPKFYKTHIGHLMAERPNFVAAGVFYALNIIGIMIFAVVPALNKSSAQSALIMGALYGFFTYATYDLTNYATLRDWPPIVTIVDIIWGTVLTATVSVVAYYITSRFIS